PGRRGGWRSRGPYPSVGDDRRTVDVRAEIREQKLPDIGHIVRRPQTPTRHLLDDLLLAFRDGAHRGAHRHGDVARGEAVDADALRRQSLTSSSQATIDSPLGLEACSSVARCPAKTFQPPFARRRLIDWPMPSAPPVTR